MESDNVRTRHEKLDALIIGYFPLVILSCLLLVGILSIEFSAETPFDILYWLCVGFVVGFVVLGIVCAFYMDRPMIKYRYVLSLLILAPVVLSVALFYIYGKGFAPNLFISRFYFFMGDGDVTVETMLAGFYVIETTIIFVAISVSSVISAYFRRYFSKLMLGLISRDPKNKSKKIATWLFDVPDIIDVEDVVLDPEYDDGKFNTEVFKEVAFDIFYMGFIICSYIFLNPYFVNEMPIEEMIMVSMLLSLFIAALIIPWHIIRAVGAKAKSQAPRDLYLWKGMKGRLSMSILAITVFMMLITLLAYLNMDFSKVLITYGSYILLVGVTSIIYSFVYVNNFYTQFKKGLIDSFNEEKEKKLNRRSETDL
ncbi:MAG: hypothetical protein VB016_04785 [Methanomassiliicoccaceae archaeon]|nr:hypothetical protein [Methanomassiliicoccaceae archaeon]